MAISHAMKGVMVKQFVAYRCLIRTMAISGVSCILVLLVPCVASATSIDHALRRVRQPLTIRTLLTSSARDGTAFPRALRPNATPTTTPAAPTSSSSTQTPTTSTTSTASSPTPTPSPSISPATGVVPDAGCITGCHGYIYADDGNVANAQGCAVPSHVITYAPGSGSCGNGGNNETWYIYELNDGYDEIAADYGGNLMCANVQGSSYQDGTDILAWPCNTTVTTNEQWRRPENTPDPYQSAWYFIVPAADFSLTWNVAGGLGSGHQVVLWSQCNCDNDAWTFGSV